MAYIHMKEEWKLFWGYMLIVFLVLLSQCSCTLASTGTINKPKQVYELVEPLGTIHKYRKDPLVGKSYYCLIHEAPEIIYVVEDTKRVRRWTGYDWRQK